MNGPDLDYDHDSILKSLQNINRVANLKKTVRVSFNADAQNYEFLKNLGINKTLFFNMALDWFVRHRQIFEKENL